MADKDKAVASRRRFFRVKREIEVAAQPVIRFGEMIRTRTLDVSATGVRIPSPRDLPRGTVIEMTFRSAEQHLEVPVRGIVAWTAPAPELGRFELGVAFNSLPPDAQANLLKVFGDGLGEERRRFVRLRKHLLADLRRGFFIFGEHALGSTHDISLGGMAVEAPAPLALAKPYRIKVFLRHEEHPLRAHAVPLVCDPGQDGRFVARMQFSGLEEADKELLGHFLSHELTQRT